MSTDPTLPVQSPAPGLGGRRSAAEIADLLGRPRPTAEQTAVIEAPLRPLLVVAGAGSGKTETMSSRVVQLIDNELVEPDRVLGLTFTRKAAGELSERVRHRLRALRRATGGGRGGSRLGELSVPTVSTYNSYAAGLVSEHALRLGVEPSSRLLGEAGRWQLAHEVVERWSGDLDTDLAPSTITDAVLALAGALAEHLVGPDDLREECERLVDAVLATPEPTPALKSAARTLLAEVAGSLRLRARLADLVEAFTERKRDADVIDFADQVALAARLARDVPAVGEVERRRYPVVLLDEYQDTSVAQLVLLRHLFGSGAPHDSQGHAVTAVGDPHQSIYGWRGASAGGLGDFPRDFPARTPDGSTRASDVLELSRSWRNDHRVLDVANTVAAPLRQQGQIPLPVLQASALAQGGEVLAAMLPTVEDEVRAVARFVAERRQLLSAAAAADGSVPDVSAAVLCRRRSQFPALQAALLAEGLPVEVVGLGGLLSAPEVVDLVAALQVVHDPSRGDALMRLLTGPQLRLGLADVAALGEWASELSRHEWGDASRTARDGAAERDLADERSIVDALDRLPSTTWRSVSGRVLTAEAARRLGALAETLRTLRSQTFLPIVDLVAETERALGLDIEVAARPGVAPASARGALDAFRGVAAEFGDATDVATLGAFLDWLDAARREEDGLDAPVGEVDPDAVQLCTVHASKGLEWAVVAVPGLVEDTFPSRPRTTGWIKDPGAVPGSLRGDALHLPGLLLTGAADGADLAQRLAAYKDAYEDHHVQEERRLAYVAVTRAKHHLLLSGSWWRDGSRPVVPSRFLEEVVEEGRAAGSIELLEWADAPADGQAKPEPAAPDPDDLDRPGRWPAAKPLGVRHRALAAAAHAARAAAVTHGAPPTGTKPDAPPDPERDATEEHPLAAVVDLLLEERRRGERERGVVLLPHHLSTSALVRLSADREAFAEHLRRPVPAAPSPHARRGTAFHAWVEQWFGRASLVDVEDLPGADDEMAAGLDLRALQEAFQASEWASRAPIAVEVDVETPVDGIVVRSRIDAVFAEADGGVVVVDWKSGRPPRDPDHIRARELQLAVYRLAWSRWKGIPLDKVRAAFFYAATGETVRPERLWDEAEIAAVVSGR